LVYVERAQNAVVGEVFLRFQVKIALPCRDTRVLMEVCLLHPFSEAVSPGFRRAFNSIDDSIRAFVIRFSEVGRETRAK
jgi:hypothetical protein